MPRNKSSFAQKAVLLLVPSRRCGGACARKNSGRLAPRDFQKELFVSRLFLERGGKFTLVVRVFIVWIICFNRLMKSALKILKEEGMQRWSWGEEYAAKILQDLLTGRRLQQVARMKNAAGTRHKSRDIRIASS
jgi:hypothetical protein